MKFWEKLVFVHIFLLGCAFAFLVPPFQKPDEQGHFKRAYYLSRGYVFLFNDGKKLPLDRQLDSLVKDKTLNSIPYHAERKISPPDFRQEIFASQNAFSPVYQKEKLMFIWGPVAYIPQAAGIFTARLIHLNAYLTFYSGRLAIFLFSLIVMVWLYRQTAKPYRYILLFVFALPMTIHQLTAYSYDAVHYLFGFLIFSLLTSMVLEKKTTTRKLAALGLAVIGFVVTKLGYEPLLLLIFVVPWKNIGAEKTRYIKIISVWILSVITAYFLITWPTYVSSATYKGNPPGVNPGKQAQYIVSHPAAYLKTLAASTWNLKKFHLQGAVGIFGWLDYSLWPWMYGVYGLAFLYLVHRLKIPAEQRLNLYEISVLASVLLFNYVFIMTVFYMNWKTVGSAQIDGTQGRYFTVFIPLTIYALLQLKNILIKK